MEYIKSLFTLVLTFLSALGLEACTVNPATGEQQFAPLMSPRQEVSVGASEHQKVEEKFGFVTDPALVNYVNKVGQRVTRDTERADVEYKFFILDTPVVNAMALPGGYIYVSRGLLALANNEAELASVLGHEAGHITARHSAERYSKSVVASLGANVLSAAIGSSGAATAIDLGTNLFLSSYSRSQESQADSLGIRYMVRAGYDAQAVPAFLSSLHQEGMLENRIHGRSESALASYFSTHPATGDRAHQTSAEVQAIPKGGVLNRAEYLRAVNGIVFGDSAEQGFVREQRFYHPKIGFVFDVPDGFEVINQPDRVVASNAAGVVMIFDMKPRRGRDSLSHLEEWAQGGSVKDVETITVNQMRGATGFVEGQVKGRPVTIRLFAIEWGDQLARFQMIIPQGTSADLIKDLKRASYSFRSLSAQEKNSVRPLRLVTFVARNGDTVASRASELPFQQYKQERFRVLNGLEADQELNPGEMYKTIEG